jgi:hypothetical protein
MMSDAQKTQRGSASGATAGQGVPAGQPAPPGAGTDDAQDYAGSPRPDAIYPQLDASQLAGLRAAGREWDQVSASPQAWREALPIDRPSASTRRPVTSARPGSPRSHPSRGGPGSCRRLRRRAQARNRIPPPDD